VVILDGSKNAAAAQKWVAYLMSPDAQKMMAQVGVMPTLSSLTGDTSLPSYFGVFMDQMKTAQARVVSPKWNDMDTAINNAYQRMLKGNQTVQQSLDQAATEINALLAKK
jgi:multiple sugar transport system substrate-binding protein